MAANIEIDNLFENNAERDLFIKNYFDNSYSEIDFEGFDDIDLVNFNEILPEIEIDQSERCCLRR